MQNIGKYKIIKQLGSGSFGFVYLAEDPKLQVQVAIKVFKVKDESLIGQVTSSANDPADIIKQRFIDEARILRKLSTNPYIVQMYEFDELEDGTPYYVMPFISRSLIDEIGNDAFSQGSLDEIPKAQYPRRLPTAQAINYLKQLTEALCAVHEASLVHRDIKPANILINEQNQIQLSDFGIAKLPLSEHSQTGFGMGSKNYMSPEQQESAKHVKPTSDIYSLGVLAYRMFTGQLPVGRFQDITDFAPEISQSLNDLIICAISQSPSQRPEDGCKFLIALSHAIEEQEHVNNESDENGTAIWTSQNTKPIKDELKTLENKIIELLVKQGEIKPTDLILLQALAELVNFDKQGLDEQALAAFIILITQQQSANSKELQSFLLWVSSVNKRFENNNQFLSNTEVNTLIEVGLNTTNKPIEQLKALIEQKQQKSNQQKKPSLIILSLLFVAVLIAVFIEALIPIYQQYENSTKEDQQEITKTNNIEKNQQQIEYAQGYLIKLGFQIGQTAQLDERTIHAIKTFEESEGLLVTGNVDDLLLKKLASVYQKKEQSLWLEAKKDHSIIAYQKYKTTFQQGQHIHQANQAIKQLKVEKSNNEKQNLQAINRQQQKVIKQATSELLNSMVTLPSGYLNMGCTQGNICKNKELPQHNVSLSTFSIMATEVTFMHWNACVISGNCTLKPNNEGWRDNNRPVINVSFNDIIEQFIPWLNKTTGEVFSLPSEAQWEYAARAGNTRKYTWGSTIDCLQARYSQFSGQCGNERNTSVVKSFKPNEFGLYDMHGNVWEWTQDCWNDNYNAAPTNGSAWHNGDCNAGVIRGGSWLSEATLLRSASRRGYERLAKANVNGFRLVINTP